MCAQLFFWGGVGRGRENKNSLVKAWEGWWLDEGNLCKPSVPFQYYHNKKKRTVPLESSPLQDKDLHGHTASTAANHASAATGYLFSALSVFVEELQYC